MNRYSITLFVLSALLVTDVGSVRGQNWVRLPLPTLSYPDQAAPYFLNESIGFVFNTSNLYKTTDGGIHWRTFGTTFGIHDSITANNTIYQIYFSSLSDGYIACRHGIFETKDTGDTWDRISPYNMAFVSIYVSGNKVYALSNGSTFSYDDFGPFISTINDGKNWDTIVPSVFYRNNYCDQKIIGNKDSLILIDLYTPGSLSNNLFYSTDDGGSWHLEGTNNDFINLFCFPHCNNILGVTDQPSFDRHTIMISADLGKNWTNTLTDEIGRSVVGNNCAIYLSYASNIDTNVTGIFRSTDKGATWKFIYGPNSVEIDDWDFENLSVRNGGAMIFEGARDSSNYFGDLWRTTDGGDGTFSASTFASNILFNQTSTINSACDTSIEQIMYQNLSCNYSLLKNFIISGLDSDEFSSVWKHHLACDGVPDTVLVKIFPFKSGPGTYTFHAHFENDEFEPIDTSFNFVILPSASSTTINTYLKTTSLSAYAGDTLKLPIYINSTQSPTQPGSADLILTFSLNSDLLTPFSFIPIFGITADPIRITKTTATVTLHSNPSFTFSGETELGKLQCAAYVTDTLETDIALTSVTHSSGCLSTLADSNIIHFSLIGCGTPTISNLMKFGTAYDIESIVPNPAENTVYIRLKNSSSLLHYELLDALGVAQKSGTISGTSLQLELSGLSSGSYYFRLSNDNGIPITKRIIIAK